MKRLMLIACLLLAPCSGCAIAQGDSKPEKTILVLPFHVASDVKGYEALSDGLADLFIADFSSFPEVSVVEREMLDTILKEQALSLAGLTSPETRLKVGLIVKANLILSGSFTLVESKLNINAHLTDVATSRVVKSRDAAGDVADWLKIEQQLARELVKDLDLNMTPKQELAIDTKPEVSLHFIRGLGCYYGCKYDQAIMEFQRTLKGDAKYADARYWMARSYEALKEADHARIEYERLVREFPGHPLAKDAAERMKE